MEQYNSVICTRCGSQHLKMINSNEYKCENCDAIITKKKAEDFEKTYRKLIKEGKDLDIVNLRKLVKNSLEGHINIELLKTCSQEILFYLPCDVLSTYYLKFIEKNSNPFAYEKYLSQLSQEATITEMDEIINLIINNTRKRDEDIIRNLAHYFYNDKYDNDIDKAIKQRQIEIELFSDIPRDVFICYASADKAIVNEVLSKLENDGNTCWISSRNIPWDSDNYWTNITNAIKSCDIFLCINSINVMSSQDCRREIEIAKKLNKKKKIEYKIDDSIDITLFKNFFTGQWITNDNDLLQKVYELKTKEDILYNEVLLLLNENNIKDAYNKILELKDITNDSKKEKNYIQIIQALDLINEKMYEDARTILLQCEDTNLSKAILKLCCKNNDNNINNDQNTYSETKDEEINNHINNEYIYYSLNDIKQLIKNKEFEKAKIIINTKLKSEDTFMLWYYLLICETKKFHDFSSPNLSEILKNMMNKTPLIFSKKVNKIVKKYENKTKSSIRGNKVKMEKNCIYFGSYPQTIKRKDVLIQDSIPNEKGCYYGSDENEYIKIHHYNYIYNYQVIAHHNHYTFSNLEEIANDKDYYFKVEPLKWRLIKKIKGFGIFVCENIIDKGIFCEGQTNYEQSNIRYWLNNVFYNIAFNNQEKDLIKEVLVDNSKRTGKKFSCNDTKDKVFLLSLKDCKRAKIPLTKTQTDYAKAVTTHDIYKNNYWTRSLFDSKGNYAINMFGTITSLESKSCEGVVPVICCPIK